MFKALKPCNFGKRYYIGDVIEDGLVDPSQIKRLIESGIIKAAEEIPAAEADKPEGRREATVSKKPTKRKSVIK